MAQVSGKDARDILSIPSASAEASSSTSSAVPTQPARPPSGPPTHHAHSRKHKAKPKIDGITRELHALLGDNAPSLAVAHHQARSMMAADADAAAGDDARDVAHLDHSGGRQGFRPKFAKRRQQKPRGWQLQSFRNPARRDDLVLSHWTPKGGSSADVAAEDVDVSQDDTLPPRNYPFAIFNTSSGVYSYSNEEYQQYLKDDDWTKEETDHLIDLCQAYDLRFIVIADRWDSTTYKPRTIEDLKARYYAICRRMIRTRISIEDVEARHQILATYSFDKNRETERKNMLARLYERTPAQLAEEEALYVEARRIEQNEAKFAADREDLLKLLGGWERIPDVTRTSIAEAGAGIGRSAGVIPGSPAAMEEALSESKRLKKRRLDGRGTTAPGDDAASATPTTATAPPPQLTSKQKAEMKQAHFDEVNCITRFDPESTPLSRPVYPHLIGTASTAPPVAPSPHNPTSSHGVFLRSTRILTPRQAQLNRTNQTLAELTPPIGTRLVFPTRRNCEKWEGLLGAVTSGLEMKKQTDRVESELRIAKNRLNALLGKAESTPAQQQQHRNSISSASAAGGRPSISAGSTSAAAAPPPSALSSAQQQTPGSPLPTATSARDASSSARGRSSTPRSVRGMSRSRTPGLTGASGGSGAAGALPSSSVDSPMSSNKKKKGKSSTAGLVGHDDDDDDDDDDDVDEEEEEEEPGDEEEAEAEQEGDEEEDDEYQEEDAEEEDDDGDGNDAESSKAEDDSMEVD